MNIRELLASGLPLLPIQGGAIPPSAANYQTGGHRVVHAGVDLGNVVDISINPEATVLNHFTRRSGTRVLDKQVVTQKRLVFTVTLDEHSVETYQKYFMATRTGQVLSILAQPLAEGVVTLRYVNESGDIFSYSHTRAVTRPANPMTFGDGTDWSSFQVEVECLLDLNSATPMGTMTVTNLS